MEILLTVGTQNGVFKNKKIYFSKTDDYVEQLKKYIVELYDKFNTALLSCDDEVEMFEFNLMEYGITLKFDGRAVSFFDENTNSSCDEMMFSILTNDLYQDVKAGKLSLNDCIAECIENYGYIFNKVRGWRHYKCIILDASAYNNFNESDGCIITMLIIDLRTSEIVLSIACNDKFGNKVEPLFSLSDFELDLATDEYVYHDKDNEYQPIVFNQENLLRMVIATILEKSKA